MSFRQYNAFEFPSFVYNFGRYWFFICSLKAKIFHEYGEDFKLYFLNSLNQYNLKCCTQQVFFVLNSA